MDDPFAGDWPCCNSEPPPARADDTVHIVNNATDGGYSTWGLANIAVVTGAAPLIVIVAFAMNDAVEVPAIGSISRAAGARPAPW